MLQDDRLDKKQKFLEYFSKVPIKKYAAAYAGRNEDTFLRWENEDADFAEQVEKTKATYLLENVPQTSREWRVERLFKDHFAPRQELTGASGEKLEVIFHTSLNHDDTNAIPTTRESD